MNENAGGEKTNGGATRDPMASGSENESWKTNESENGENENATGSLCLPSD